jgi:hypothetical protein
VVDYLTDISAVGLGPSNLLYNVYQYAVGYEVHLYLEALNGEKGTEVELLVATAEDDPEQVTGFLCTCRCRATGKRAAWPTWRCAKAIGARAWRGR